MRVLLFQGEILFVCGDRRGRDIKKPCFCCLLTQHVVAPWSSLPLAAVKAENNRALSSVQPPPQRGPAQKTPACAMAVGSVFFP
uniref:Uncharacterized protein n=1 Tax=Falco tinnunculus TaxID=100819 RepID=A0A8C4XPX6_FALTI